MNMSLAVIGIAVVIGMIVIMGKISARLERRREAVKKKKEASRGVKPRNFIS